MTAVATPDVVFQEVARAKNGAGESASLLGPMGRGMRLKISRDKPRASDIVELASRRCSVGSGARCDVRVDEPGVAPLACLIFHGSKNNVVRWLDASQDATGGELFQDEILCAGDPLQIGPVELELLVDEIMAAEEPVVTDERLEASEDRLLEYLARLERLEIQLGELQQASEAAACLSDAMVSNSIASNHEVAASISGLAAQLADFQSRSVTDHDLWAGERAELEALLQSRLREFDVLQEEVERVRDELVTVRGEYGKLSANHDATERLVEVTQDLAVRTEEFEQERADWERDRGEFQRQLQQHMQRLEQFEKQLAGHSTRQADSEAARQAAEARADRLQESVEELSRRLAEQQVNYESVRAAWEADRASLESELAETKQRLAESAAAEPDELDLPESIERPIEAAELPEDRGASAALDNPMERLLAGDSLPNLYADEVDEPIRDFASTMPINRGEDESSYPEDCYSDDEYADCADAAANDYQQVSNSLQSTAYLADETESVEDEVEEIEFKPAASAPPVSTADVLARLGHSGLWSGDETDADDASDTRDSDADNLGKDVFSQFMNPAAVEPQSEQPQYTPIQQTPFASSNADAASNSGDAEESIEAYMARLMNRVRGTDHQVEPPRRAEPTVERSPVTEYTEVAKSPKTVRESEPEKFDPEEYKPRSQAPEIADRMTAMRSLANDSARTAIASHAKRNWSSVMQLKLLVSVFAFVSVVASVIFFWGDPILMGLGSLLGLGLLAYWARTAITYRKLLLDSLMLEPEGGDCDESTSDDETA